LTSALSTAKSADFETVENSAYIVNSAICRLRDSVNAASTACAVVTNLPSAEIKKPLSVRNKFPLESKVVTQSPKAGLGFEIS
jgi:hypothetical protein